MRKIILAGLTEAGHIIGGIINREPKTTRCPFRIGGCTGHVVRLEVSGGFKDWEPIAHQCSCNICSALFMGDPEKISKLKLSAREVSNWKIKAASSGTRLKLKLNPDEEYLVAQIKAGKIIFG